MRYNFRVMTSPAPTVILGAKRTPIGDLRGELSSLLAPALGAVAVRAALEEAGVPPDAVGETLMGCVLPAGQGQAPARQAARAAGIPDSVPAATLNKMCGSGMFAAMLADDRIRAGRADFIVAGGMESMSNAPHLVDIRGGARMGDAPLRDHMFADGLLDAYEGELMGVFAQRTADQSGFSREEMDDFAVESIRRAQKSQAEETDQNEIVPVVVPARKGDVTVRQDELPRKARPENIPNLRPAFCKDGTVTAANSSGISDGAAALILANADAAEKRGLRPLARIVAQSTHARAPAEFTLAPSGAIQKALDFAGWKAEDADLYEINEAFAAVTMAATRALGVPHERVNIFGGACAMGHPVGASGARIVCTLLNALRVTGKRRGIASLCIGGGEATALAIELV